MRFLVDFESILGGFGGVAGRSNPPLGATTQVKIREQMWEKAMLKTYSESDAKKLPKGSQKGCQEASKIEFLEQKWLQEGI